MRAGPALVEKYRRYGLNYSRSWTRLRYIVGKQEIMALMDLLENISTQGQSIFCLFSLKKLFFRRF